MRQTDPVWVSESPTELLPSKYGMLKCYAEFSIDLDALMAKQIFEYISTLIRGFWLKYSRLALLCGYSFLLAAVSMVLLPPIASAQVLSTESSPQSGTTAIPQGLAETQIDQFIAPLTDRDARALLRSSLVNMVSNNGIANTNQDEPASGGGAAGFLEQLRNGSNTFSENFTAIKTALPTTGAATEHAMLLLTDLEGAPRMRVGIYNLIAMIALGLTAAFLVNRLFCKVEKQFLRFKAETLTQKLRLLALRGSIKSVELVAFFITGKIVSLLYFDRYDPMRLFLLAWFSTIAVYFFSTIIGRVLLSPAAPNLRLITMDSPSARKIFKGFVWSITLAAFTVFNVAMFVLLGVPEPLLTVWQIAMGTIIATVILFSVNWNKSLAEGTLVDADPLTIKNVATPEDMAHRTSEYSTDSLRSTFTLLKIVGCIVLYVLWGRAVISQDTPSSIAAVVMLLAIAISLYLRMIPTSSPEGTTSSPKSIQTITSLFWAIAFATFIQAAGIDLYGFSRTENGQEFTLVLAKVVLTILVGMALWSMLAATIKMFLDRDHAKAVATVESSGNSNDGDRDEGGGVVGSRLGTLLPLFRGFAFVFVTVVTMMFALSIVGINIGPLLAGAGVMGIAIGFGAQTLVKDIFSGIFFLADDAFRIGEYVETGIYKGTVEKISIRSMRLRHHRGAVITVPFGELRAITNHNRDWAIYKQDFELPWETDLEVVRKIIKKIGVELLDDPEHGWKFITPVKSQGVKRVENGALVLGTKFTCVPTEQWVIRRFVYQRVRDQLYDAGIHLAHRRVQIEWPEEHRTSNENTDNAGNTVENPLLSNTARTMVTAAASHIAAGEDSLSLRRTGSDARGQ